MPSETPAPRSNPRSNPWLGALFGGGIGIATGLMGFFLVITGNQAAAGMGVVMFFLVPVAAGFAIALFAGPGVRALAASILATMISLIILIAFGKEGVLCALLALPLLAVGLAIGLGIGLLVGRRFKTRGPGTSAMIFLSLPVFLFGSRQVELKFFDYARTETVISQVTVQAAREQAWDAMGTIDRIEAAKPPLMYIGLPVPVRCVMKGAGVGAKRTCYFENGYIEETVTKWEPPSRMELSIDRTAMPGRHWLSFEYAVYEFQPEGDSTRLSRTTVIHSNLTPSGYWRTFERMGVEQEHEYIFRDLQRRLSAQAR
ncbi:MAG: SRPBCC family protein [Acidobacteriales bacterium]|nr:SRPBCC family protein [Terriglobales bacterium]